MRTRAEVKPVLRGRVIGLGLGKFRFASAAGAGVALALAATCLAGPENPRVTAGKATIRQRGNTTVIRAGDRSIIDYSSFDIGRHETVRFIQPGAQATVLNRIHSVRPTTIDGTLTANGRVYLVNPGGIIFSGTSVVNTGGLVAAAGTMSNADFLAGRDHFTGVQGDVVNAGRITSPSTALIGRHVANSGVIDASGGSAAGHNAPGLIAMVAGDEVTLTRRGDTMSVRVATDAAAPAPSERAGVENTGRINAGKGQSLMLAGDIYSLAVRNTGAVRAKEITLAGQGDGRVEVGGRLDASARAVGGVGGRIDVTGGRVEVRGANLDARGATRGGSIRVGGDAHGGSGLAASQSTYVDAGTSLRADAVRRGDGGSAVVWSDGNTNFHGRVSARGGSVSGNGGSIETSAKATLNIDGASVNAGVTAAGAKAGQWLVDPTDFEVNAGNVAAFNEALDMDMTVTIETGSGGADAGNVTINAEILKSAGESANLTIRAENDVVVNQPIRATAGTLDVNIQANTAGNGNADADTTAGSFIVNNDGGANLGAIDTNGGSFSVAAVDVALNGADATIAADGGVQIVANSSADQSIGLGGGAGAMTLTEAELQQIDSTGTVSITQADRTDAVDIDNLDLSGEGFNLTVEGGTTTVDNITLASDRTLRLAAGADTLDATLTVGGAIAAPNGTVEIEADDVDLAGGTISAGTDGTVRYIARAGNGFGLGVMDADGLTLDNAEIDNTTAGTLEIRTAGGASDGVAIGTIAPANAQNLDVRSAGMIDVEQITMTGSVLLRGGDLTIATPGAANAIEAGAGGIRLEPFGVGDGIGIGDAPGTFTLSADELLELSTPGGVTIGRTDGTGELTVGGSSAVDLSGAMYDLTLRAHQVTVNRALTTGGSLTILGNDLAITSQGMLAPGMGSGTVTIGRHTNGAIDVGGGTFGGAPGNLERLEINNDELARIDAGELIIGDAMHTQLIRVQGVRDPSAPTLGSSPSDDDLRAQAHQDIDKITLAAERDNGAIIIGGTQTSFFKSLEARADAGIEISQSITATTGGLLLDADFDGADDDMGAVGIDAHDTLAVMGNRTLTTLGMPADAPDITLRGRRAMGENGITADGALTVDSARDVNIDQSLLADAAVTLQADRQVRLASGTTLTQNAGELRIIAGDAVIDGTIAGEDVTVRIGRSSEGDVQMGDFTDADPDDGVLTISNDELMRITADRLFVGNFETNENTQNITVNGVTAVASQNISGLTTLGAAEDITFSGAASTFNSLEARANDDLTVAMGAPLTTDDGDMGLRADVDDDGTGNLAINAGVFTRGANFTGQGADIAIAAPVNAAADGMTGEARGDVRLIGTRARTVVNNVSDNNARTTINDAELQQIVAQNLTIGSNSNTSLAVRDFSEADGAGIAGSVTFIAAASIDFDGTSRFGQLGAQAGDTINVNGDLTTTRSDLTLDANTDNDGLGVINVAPGGRTLTSAGNLLLTTADDQNISSPGEGAGVTADGPLTLIAAGNVEIDGPAATSGNMIVHADNNADGMGQFRLRSRSTMTISGGNLEITAADVDLGAVSGSSQGVINVSEGDVRIERSNPGRITVGGTGAVDGALVLDAMEFRKINASNITIGGMNTARMDVRNLTTSDTGAITGRVRLQALGMNGGDAGEVVFDAADYAFRTLNVEARSEIDVRRGTLRATGGSSSGTITLDAAALTADARDGVIFLGGDITAQTTGADADVNLRGAVRLRSNVTITAGDDIRLFSTVDSTMGNRFRSLTLNARGATNIDGDVGSRFRLGGLTTDAPGRTRLAANVYTDGGSGIRFRDRVIIAEDVVLHDTGETGVYFHNSINGRTAGGQSLTIITDLDRGIDEIEIPVIAFGGNVGGQTPLRSLNLNIGEGFAGAVNGHVRVPRVATIVTRRINNAGANADQFVGALSRDDTFRIVTTEGFTMGRNEKLTSGGNLEIRAIGPGATATIGDLTAFGSILVDADDIRIRARNGARYAVAPQGTGSVVRLSRVPDLGVDFVAGTEINFTDIPTVIEGEGRNPPTFGTPSGARTSDELAGFLFRRFSSTAAFDANTLQASSTADGVTRIVTLDVTSVGPSDTNFSEVIAGAVPREARSNDVATDPTMISEDLFTDLEQLGVSPRGLTAAERQAGLVGWSTYDDYPLEVPFGDTDLRTLVTRLPASQTRAVLSAYQDLFFVTATDPATGETRQQSRAGEIRAAFDDAARRYRAVRPGDEGYVDPMAFREYIERTPGEEQARSYARALGDLIADLELLGLTGRELRKSKLAILSQVRPQALGADIRNTEVFIRHQPGDFDALGPAPEVPALAIDQ